MAKAPAKSAVPEAPLAGPRSEAPFSSALVAAEAKMPMAPARSEADGPRAARPAVDAGVFRADVVAADIEGGDDPSVPEASQAAQSTAQADSGRAEPRNPWWQPVPRSLRNLRKRLLRGERGNERTVTYLRRYNRDNPDDPRGHLLLARLYMNRNWESDTVAQYEFAFNRDAASRGDPRMLRDLLLLASHRKTARKAGALVRRAYGDEAEPALELAIRDAEEEDMRGYLTRLRDSLERLP